MNTRRSFFARLLAGFAAVPVVKAAAAEMPGKGELHIDMEKLRRAFDAGYKGSSRFLTDDSPWKQRINPPSLRYEWDEQAQELRRVG